MSDDISEVSKTSIYVYISRREAPHVWSAFHDNKSKHLHFGNMEIFPLYN